ncbi:MAG: T9SS type A sorting domain-containing protein [Crocinitomicaceae bacterium]|nr:T9SS type A sorting domain-containing protein [Crocinitomicaceae bacterium]
MIKKFSAFLFLLYFSFSVKAQFGFERIDTIDVYRSSILQKYAWVGGLDYAQFSNIDLDFDGTEDVFVFDRTNNKVLTFIQQGIPGTIDLVYAPEYESKFPEYKNIFDPYEDEDYLFNWVLLVDYNCDGKKDIFAARSGGIKVYKNTGNSTDGLSFEIVSLRLKSFQYTMQQYLYVSNADLPGIKDIDGDGDVDILTFGGTGQAIEYHKNLSMETYGHCDSLYFEMKNICWGLFQESATTNSVTLWDTLSYPCDDQIANPESWHPSGGGDRHSGSTVTPLDMNNNGVMDLLVGDISYGNLVMLMNSGIAPNTDSGMNSADPNFPSSSLAADVSIYPGAYHVDINNDGKRDLVVTPSSKVGSENRTATWYYFNTGTDLSPVFIYQQDDFMQDGMIDVGSRSFPVFFDHNGDGLKDLIVSSQGHFDSGTGNQISSIYYYENTGTLANPEFTFVTDDYMNISTMGIGLSLYFYPTFGDLDNDGDEDMVLGEYSGYCYYFENTGGAGNPAIFSTYIMLNDYMSNPLVTPTNAGIYIVPVLVDLDRDDDLDLVLGRRNGQINYYENIGNASAYSFMYLTNNLGGINVSEWWSIEGFAVPQFVDVNGTYKMIIGAKNGYLHLYDSIEGNIGNYFHLVDSTLDNIQTGTYAAPAIYDLNNDGRYEMVVGNERGGLVLFKSADTSNIGVKEIASTGEIKVYPNPAENCVTIDFSNVYANNNQAIHIEVIDITGRKFMELPISESKVQLNISQLPKGTYILKITSGDLVFTKRIVKI